MSENKNSGKIEKIEGVSLAELVAESSKELIKDKRFKAASVIKKYLQRVEQLAIDVRSLEKELKKKKEKLEKAQAKINRIKEGDWSLLSTKEDGSKRDNGTGENN